MRLRPLLFALLLPVCSINHPMHSQEQQKTAPGHYLFAWTGDAPATRCSPICPPNKGNDFLAVIDANPLRPRTDIW